MNVPGDNVVTDAIPPGGGGSQYKSDGPTVLPSNSPFVKIQRFCRCRYLEVPTTAKPLYLHKSTSRAHQLCYWHLMSPKLGN
jgi:hypothetical protein